MSGTDDAFEIDGEAEETSPIGAVRERLRGIENDIENLIDLLNGMRAVSDILEDKRDTITIY